MGDHDHVVRPGAGAIHYEGHPPTLLIHQAAGLVKHTQTLARLSLATQQPDDQTALVVATYLTAAAAIEAILSEAAHDHKPDLYANENFRKAGAPNKFDWLLREPAPEQLKLIWGARKALTHSEPDHARTGELGNHITTAGAADAAKFVDDLRVDVTRKISAFSGPPLKHAE